MLEFLKGQIAQSLGRKLLTAAASALGTYGILDANGEAAFVAAGLAIVTVVLSVISARTKARAVAVADAVEATPGVQAVNTSSKTDPVAITINPAQLSPEAQKRLRDRLGQ